MKKIVLSGYVFVFLLISFSIMGMDELYLYANFFQDSIIFPDIKRDDPTGVAAEKDFEALVVKKYRDELPENIIKDINRIVKSRESLLKAFYMKLKNLPSVVNENDMKSYYEEIKKEKFYEAEKREFWYLFISAYTEPETVDWNKARKEKIEAENQLRLENKSIESLEKKWNTTQYYGNKCIKIGPVERGKYSEQIDNIIFSLKEGETSDFIETPKGFIMIKMVKIVPAYFRKYEDVKDNIVRYLFIDLLDKQILGKMKEELWKKYNISYNWKEWENPDKKPEILNQLKRLCARLSVKEDCITSPIRNFEESVFDLVLSKEFNNLGEKENNDCVLLKKFLENRHIVIRALEYEAGKKSKVLTFTEEELREFYDKQPGYFYQRGIIEARLATFRTGKKDKLESLSFKNAKEVADFFYQRLTQGDDFAMLAKKFSQDQLAEKGGYVGIVDEQKSRMGAIFDINAFDLKEGEFSKPLRRSGKGDYIIIKVDKVIREKKLLPFEQVKEKVEKVFRDYKKGVIFMQISNELYEEVKNKLSDDIKNRDNIIIHPIYFAWF